MSGRRVFIDGDGCPRAVLHIVFRAADKRDIRVVMVANRDVQVPRHPNITKVKVPAGMDVADAWLVQNASPQDLVLTSDVPLAAELVAKGVTAVSFRGDTYTKATIGDRKAMRDFHTEAREAGILTGGGPPPFDARASKAFAGAFDGWLTRALRG